jgi:outer membrane protein assembly factor BamB
MTRLLLIAVTGLSLFSVSVWAGDWPQFMGPERNGIGKETGLLRQWPRRGPREVWSEEIGEGFGGASIKEGKVYILDRRNNRYDSLRCFDLLTGKELGHYENEVRGRIGYNGSRSVATLGEQFIFAVGPFGHVYCIDQTIADLVWGLDMVRQYQADVPKWGYSHSPLLVNDMVVVAPLSEGVGLVALDQATGEVRWESPPVPGSSYVSPVLATISGQEGVLFQTGDEVVFLDAKNGKVLWRYTQISRKHAIPIPTVLDKDRVFITGGYGGGSVMIQLKQNAEKVSFEELFRFEREGSVIHPAIYYNEHFFANFNTNENLRQRAPLGLVCFDVAGKVRWGTGDVLGMDRGGFIIADGLIIALDGASGELILADANPEVFNGLSRVEIFEGGRDNKIWAPLALSDGFLVVRDQHHLKCFYLKARAADEFDEGSDDLRDRPSRRNRERGNY